MGFYFRYSAKKKKKAERIQNKTLQPTYMQISLPMNLKNVWKPLGPIERTKGKQQLIKKYDEVQLKIRRKVNFRKKITAYNFY